MRASCIYLCACVLLAARARAADPPPEIQFHVRPLTSVVRGRGVSLPVQVEIQQSQEKLQGSLDVCIGDTAAVTWTRVLNLGRGRYQFTAYPMLVPYPGEMVLHVAIRDAHGRVMGAREIPLRQLWNEMHVLAVLGQGRRLEVLQGNKDRVVVTPARDTTTLPDHWSGYTLFDAVFWDVGQARTLTRDQADALRDWVRSGGRLILGATAEDMELKLPVPELAPEITATRMTPTPATGPIWNVKEFPGDTVELFTEREAGLGSIAFLRTDYRTTSFNHMGQVNALFSGIGGWLANQQNVDESGMERNSNPEGELKAPLGTLAGAEPVRFASLLWVLIPYIVCVSLIDYWFGRWIRRPGFTWLTFPLLIGVFSAVSFLAFYRGALGNDRRSRLTLVDISLDGMSRTTTWTCLRGRYAGVTRLAVGTRSHVVPFIEEGNAGGYRYFPSQWKQPVGTTREVLGEQASRVLEFSGPVGVFHFCREQRPEYADIPRVDAEVHREAGGAIMARLQTQEVIDPATARLVFQNKVYTFNAAGRLNGHQPVPLLERSDYSSSYYSGFHGNVSDVSTVKGIARDRIYEYAVSELSLNVAGAWGWREMPQDMLAMDRRMGSMSLRTDCALLVVPLQPASPADGSSTEAITYVRRIVRVRPEPEREGE